MAITKMTKLRKLILDQELPQYRLAGLIGFHPSTLSEYALGHKVILNTHVVLLCRYFQLPADKVTGYCYAQDIIEWAEDATDDLARAEAG